MNRSVGGLCTLLLLVVPVRAEVLSVTRDNGQPIAQVPMPAGAGWCVLWNHSVQGFQVADCYVNDAGRMVLKRSHLPDFASGLDHVPGRGRQVSDGRGGYWIEDIDEAVTGNGYALRTGGPKVNHRLQVGEQVISLSAAARRERVWIRLRPAEE